MKLNRRVLVFAALVLSLLPLAQAQDDFLTPGEVDEVRDAQEPGKRIEAYLVIAQRRIDAIKAGIASPKAGTGRAVQKKLKEYTSILEAIEDTIDEGREKRTLRDKDLKKADEQETEFLTYLKSLNTKDSPGYVDYRFTLDEAIDTAEEILAETREGAYPEVEGREPPRLPAAAPRPPRESPPPLPEDGPPRRRRRR